MALRMLFSVAAGVLSFLLLISLNAASVGASQERDVSQWCADRVVGIGDDGRRFTVSVLWEAEKSSQGQAICNEMNTCALSDLDGDGIVGIPDFRALVPCIGTSIESWLPVPSPGEDP